MKLSVLIPVYNERYLAEKLIRKVLSVRLPDGLEKELIVVDDGSTDGTRAILERLAAEIPQIRYIPHARNQGKGAAIRTAIAAATGDFTIFQDADLEYDPDDYPRILEPLLSGQADVVYGSRFLGSERQRVLYFWHSLGNHFLTLLSNIFTDLNLTDMETCYKAFRTEVLRSIPIRSQCFGIEPEITAKVAKRGLRLYEVPIRYDGRTYLEGKKITWRDGVRALRVILTYRLIDDIYDEKTAPEYLTDLSRAHRVNRWTADALRPFLGERVLEIGAGLGAMTGMLLPRERFVASDAKEAYVAILKSLALRRSGIEVARIDPEQTADFEQYTGKLDSIVYVSGLENTADPGAVLKNFFDALEPNGRATILVPQGPWLFSPLDKTLGHRRRFGEKELAAALEHAGFRVEQTFDFNRIGALGWLLNGVLLRREKMAKIQLKAFDSLVWLFRRIDWLWPWPGLDLVAVARKPGPAAAPDESAAIPSAGASGVGHAAGT
ncbi:MAG: glycosyltransferase [Planctomycetes bacterium]|nr:glycosyltransferase [Planctomycetota bacterium]